MFKVAVLSLLVLGCSALPFQSGLRYGGYGQQTFLTSQPKISVVGLNSGYSGYGSGLGLSSGFLGSGYGSGYSSYGSGLQLGGIRSAGYGYGSGYGSGALLASAPVATQVVAAPVATIAAPIATTQVLTAAPALQSVQSYGLNNNINLLNVRQGQQFQQVVPAAIQQIARTVEYRTLPNQEQPIQAQVVEVEPSDNPVHLHFKTRSSTLSASQSHIAAGATEVQTAAAQDEPQRLITEVQKPVIQEVKEVISPFRQVTQEINPVVESLHTIVTKGDGQRQQYAGQQLVGQYSSQQYVAPASFQTQTLAAPALQTIAVQSAPAIQTVAAPLQTLAVQSAPVAVETVAVQSAPAIAIQSAPSAFQTYTQGSPSSFSLQLGSNQKLGYGSGYGYQSKVISQPISSGSYSSYSSSSSGY